MTHQIIRRVYVDTSVVGGAFNRRLVEQTQPFWDAFERGEFKIIISDVLKNEIDPAPQRARDFLASFPEQLIERVVSTPESDALAARYIAENVVGPTSLDDCKHIAMATIAGADVLVSWNFKHIVKHKTIIETDFVNAREGYKRICMYPRGGD